MHTSSNPRGPSATFNRRHGSTVVKLVGQRIIGMLYLNTYRCLHAKCLVEEGRAKLGPELMKPHQTQCLQSRQLRRNNYLLLDLVIVSIIQFTQQ